MPKTVPSCSHVLGSKYVLIVLDYSVERCKNWPSIQVGFERIPPTHCRVIKFFTEKLTSSEPGRNRKCAAANRISAMNLSLLFFQVL